MTPQERILSAIRNEFETPNERYIGMLDAELLLAIVAFGADAVEIESMYEYDKDNTPNCAPIETSRAGEFYAAYVRLGPDKTGIRMQAHLIDNDSPYEAFTYAQHVATALGLPMKARQSIQLDTNLTLENTPHAHLLTRTLQ